jgi:hypothetical protein
MKLCEMEISEAVTPVQRSMKDWMVAVVGCGDDMESLGVLVWLDAIEKRRDLRGWRELFTFGERDRMLRCIYPRTQTTSGNALGFLR